MAILSRWPAAASAGNPLGPQAQGTSMKVQFSTDSSTALGLIGQDLTCPRSTPWPTIMTSAAGAAVALHSTTQLCQNHFAMLRPACQPMPPHLFCGTPPHIPGQRRTVTNSACNTHSWGQHSTAGNILSTRMGLNLLGSST